MNRRTYLGVAAGTVGLGIAGCLGGSKGAETETLLPEPDSNVDPEALPYPGYGQSLPEVTLRDPIADEEVTTTQFDDRNVLMTFFYSQCNTVCPLLLDALGTVQSNAANEGYSDDVVHLAVTFDPARDDADRLGAWGEAMNIDVDADNWHFLRPETDERATEVVNETYGVGFERTGSVESDKYMFNHLGLIVLANTGAVVERAYVGDGTRGTEVTDDVERLLDEQGRL